MNTIKRKFLGLMIAGLGLGLSTTTVTGCGEDGGLPLGDDLCGPCGTIATGQLSIAGNAQIDGFFNAVYSFNGATGKIKADFDADIRALAEVWGYGEAGAEIDVDFVDGLVATIKTDIETSVDGDLKINYVPATCQANVNVAVEAQASCEAQAECDVEVDPGEVSVACEGTCEGSCSGSCSGEASCAVKAPTLNCEGTCEGACEIEGSAMCEGTCRGTCTGECSLKNAQGQCEGECSELCEGTCELTAKAQCNGTCHGTCYVDQDSPQCSVEAECAGSCDAECSGSCEGSFTPPSASADCEASLDCNSQASAQASANLECTPPQLDISFAFSAELEGKGAAQAAFTAKMTELRIRGVAILQGMSKLSALVTGQVEGQAVFTPAPVAQILGELETVIDATVSGDLDIPAGRIPCVIPALTEAAEIMGGAAGDFAGTIEAQVKFASVFGIGG